MVHSSVPHEPEKQILSPEGVCVEIVFDNLHCKYSFVPRIPSVSVLFRDRLGRLVLTNNQVRVSEL